MGMPKYLFYLTKDKEDAAFKFLDEHPERPIESFRDFYNSLKQNIKKRELE